MAVECSAEGQGSHSEVFISNDTWSSSSRFNLRLVYYVWFLFRLMDTVSYGPFFDAYLSELSGGGVSFVGMIETINSLTMVLVAFPLGAVSDKHARTKVMRANALLGALACALYIPAVISGSRALLLAAVITYAVYNRSYGGTMDMMVADAVTPKTVTHVSTRKTQCGTLGLALGPMLQIVEILLSPGSDSGSGKWNLSELKFLVLSGWLVFPFVAPAQCCFKELPLRPHSDSSSSTPTTAPPSSASAVSEHDSINDNELGEDVTSSQVEAVAEESKWWRVPVMLEFFRFACLLCAGMTTRYFALLFKNLFGMGPMGVALLFAFSPLLQTLALQATPPLLDRLGRPAAALLLHALSCLALVAVAVAPSAAIGSLGFLAYQVTVKMLDIPIYAIVLETVKPEHRGKFFHLLSIKPLTFGASALVGGYIVDVYGYRAAVATTGISLLILATPLLVIAVWLMRRR
eukprot:TRINITY_DN26871_c0_g1_i1.p1 TRINITY_DN26871_c0_g1~~TRINITY_DN26871_c0_g1_i1.p1  ORF type:complete len:462 (-),score=60.42 TRINITY_DN26871_c0_g1_i1:74-1459(-)